MADIFLSYAREDEAFARPLAETLSRMGWSVFWDLNIPLGQSWRAHIDQAIEGSRCVIVMWSEHSVVSRWVVDEAEEGLRKGILVPVLLRRAVVPRGFRQLQYADLTDGRMDIGSPQVQVLVREVRRVLGSESGMPGLAPLPQTTAPMPAPPQDVPVRLAPVIPLLGAPLLRADGNPWSFEAWSVAEQAYREWVIAGLRKTRLIGSSHEIDLDAIFTEVHFLPGASATRRFGVGPSSFSDFDEVVDRRKGERFGAIEALKEANRLYLLGTPGAGKSTFLRHVAVLAARRQLPGLPLFVALKEWADSGLDLAPFVATLLEPAFGLEATRALAEVLLAAPETLLLFDGLDEVPEQGQARIRLIRGIDDAARRYPRSRIVLSCRTSATDHLFQSFRYVEVADFQPEQQKAFANRWFDGEPRKAAMFLEQLAADGARALRDLGRKPLFLAFLCIAFDQTLEFPRTRSALYAEAIEVLLIRWDANRSIQREMYGLVGPQRKKLFLAQLACRTFELDQYAMSTMLIEAVLRRFVSRLPGGDQLGDLDGSLLARSFEAAHGILVERAAGVFSFAHLSIHEYFAGLGLAHKAAAGARWAELVPQEAVHSSRWREVLVHASTAASDGEAFLDHLVTCVQPLCTPPGPLKMVVMSASFIAGHEDMFAEFARGPLRYLKHHSQYREGLLQDFVPSPRLAAALARLDRAVLYGLKQYRELQKEVPAALVGAWRRLEVLREALSDRHGLALLVGMLPDPAKLDEQLARYFDAQELLLTIADEVYINDRDRYRQKILTTQW